MYRIYGIFGVERLKHVLAEVMFVWFYGGGFFLACEDFGRMFDNSFPAFAFFSFFF